MSRISDIVEAEAAEAEAEDTDAADAEEAASVSVEKALAAMEKENVRHAARVQQIMGDDFALVHPCPNCQDFAAGFTLTPPDTAPPVLHGAEYEACAKCNGYGLVLTGSLAEHGRTQTCLACNGQGFVTKPVEPVALPPMPFTTDRPAMSGEADRLRSMGYMVIDPPTTPRAV
jgi:hypothetical protein